MFSEAKRKRTHLRGRVWRQRNSSEEHCICLAEVEGKAEGVISSDNGHRKEILGRRDTTGPDWEDSLNRKVERSQRSLCG